MPRYSLTVETTSNTNTGPAIQFLAPASKLAKLIAVMINPMNSGGTMTPGQWVVDRITAVASGSSLTPLKMDDQAPRSSEITDTTKTISTTLACSNTVGDSAILQLAPGWNFLEKLGVISGLNKGFAIRRATAPSGAQVCQVTAVWEEP